VILLTRFCKLLTRVATPSGGGTCLKCLNGTTPLGGQESEKVVEGKRGWMGIDY